jgi:hypothetical protein
MKTTINVYAPSEGMAYNCPVINEKAIEGYGTMYTVSFGKYGDEMPVIITNSGEQFTPYDWTNPYDGEWQTVQGIKAVMIDGLPYMI